MVIFLFSNAYSQSEFKLPNSYVLGYLPGYFGSVQLNDDKIVTAFRRDIDIRCSNMGFYTFDQSGEIQDSIIFPRLCDSIQEVFSATSIVTDGKDIYYAERLFNDTLKPYAGCRWFKYDPEQKILELIGTLAGDDEYDLSRLKMYYDKQSNSIILYELFFNAPYCRVTQYQLNNKNFKPINYPFSSDESLQVRDGYIYSAAYGYVKRYSIENDELEYLYNDIDGPFTRSIVSSFNIYGDRIVNWGLGFTANIGFNSPIGLVATAYKTHDEDSEVNFKFFTSNNYPCAYSARYSDDMAPIKSNKVAPAFYTMGIRGDTCFNLSFNYPETENYFGVVIMDYDLNICDTIAYKDGISFIQFKHTLNDSIIALGGDRAVYENGGWKGYDFVRFINVAKSCSTSGHNDPITIPNIEIYPNPVTTTLNLKLKEYGIVRSVQIFNSLGQLVKSSALDLRDQVDVSELSPGIYFLKGKLRTGEMMEVGRFIKF